MDKIRVLVVDDSAVLRRHLPRLLETDPDIEVVGVAANGLEAIEMVKKLRPDVVTLDVLMPVMDGLAALKRIMAEAPTAVIMVSVTTQEGARETVAALAAGALDVVSKESSRLPAEAGEKRRELLQKVRMAHAARPKIVQTAESARNKFRLLREESLRARPATGPLRDGRARSVIAIAASTGGPAALQSIIPQLPANLNAGIVIVQHISSGFTQALAERLDGMSELRVREAGDGDPILPGLALIAPAGIHMVARRTAGRLVVGLQNEPAGTLHCPAADVLFHSLAGCAGVETCGIVLTGMGDDGAQGLRAIREAGGWTIAQDEASAIIYGMPRRAVELGGACISAALDQMPQEILRACGRTPSTDSRTRD